MLNKLDYQIVNLMSLKLEKNKYSAFTLIELLVVIAIIAILSTFSVITLSSARDKARDAKRLSDVKNITTALEMYYNDSGVYPLAPTPTGTLITNLCFSDAGITSTCGATVYIGKLPNDPTGNRNYSYVPINDRSYYTLAFALETGVNGYEADNYIATPTGIHVFVCGTDTVTDADGYNYPTVLIGTQCWFQENLRATKYNDGSDIPHVTDDTAWQNNTSGAYTWYNNNIANIDYGALYNWYAVSPTKNGGKNLCPSGWHVPTDAEFKTLVEGQVTPGCESTGWKCSPAGDRLKASSASVPIAWNGDNISGFTALPAGDRSVNGSFLNKELFANFWSSSVKSSNEAWGRYLYVDYLTVDRDPYYWTFGFSVRCIKD